MRSSRPRRECAPRPASYSNHSDAASQGRRRPRASNHSDAAARGRRRAKSTPDPDHDHSTDPGKISDHRDNNTEASSGESSRKISDPDFVDHDDTTSDRVSPTVFGGGGVGDDCSSLDSDASGPAPYRLPTPVQAPPPPLKQDVDAPSSSSSSSSGGLCPGCQRLFREAMKKRTNAQEAMKKRRTNTTQSPAVVDNDPASLACDQWVLRKEWRPKRPPNINGRLGAQVSRIKRRRQNKPSEEDRERPACRRPHTFLQRNLRLAAAPAAATRRTTRHRRRKRGRRSGQGPLVAKRLRLHDDHPVPRDDGRQADPEREDSDNDGDDDDDILTFRVVPSLVAVETPEPPPPPPPSGGAKQEVMLLRRRRDFSDLLAQVRRSSSVIVRETRT